MSLWLSNNPHIINREKYVDFVNKGYIVLRNSSRGVEERISNSNIGVQGGIYGPYNYPATITHLNGRGYSNGCS